jgi:type VI secretion system secreted protein VgrG
MNSTVPDILSEVLSSLNPRYEWEGKFEPRDYCVQFRETDFNFASRLMEEEGIYYFFEHSAGNHQMVVTNKPQTHPTVEEPSTVIYKTMEGGPAGPNQVFEWTKSQELRSSRYRLWDYTFQIPWNNLEATSEIPGTQEVGQVVHHLKLKANTNSEIYEFPGEYAQRFDAIDKAGQENKNVLKKITTDQEIQADNKRTADIRIQGEAYQSLRIHGSSTCPQFLPAYKFNLQQHFDADGEYVLTSAEHFGTVGAAYRTGQPTARPYQNTFSCIPGGLPLRPFRVTSKPIAYGTQSAYVVGPEGAEIHTDKYGRVKVQFHWDRTGKYDAERACWIRVAQVWAGKRWGASFWPRVGQEVIVAFEEGDPDQPIIVGSVYSPDQMAPYLGDGLDSKHKNDNKVSGLKSNTTTGGEGFNELRFDDTKDKQQLFLHAERNLDITTKNDSLARTYGNRHQIIGYEKDGKKGGDQREMVYQDKHIKVHRNQIEQIGDSMQLLVGGIDSGQGNQDVVIKGTRKESIGKDDNLQIIGSRKEQIGGAQSLSVGGDQQEKIGKKHAVDAGQEIHLKAGMKIIIEAGVQVSLKGPGGFVDVGPAGVTIQGTMVLINSGGSAGSGSGSRPDSAEAPTQANPTAPDSADDSKSGQKSTRS